jgi:hypothetical protein
VTATSEDVDLLVDRIRTAIDWQDAGHFDEETGIEYPNTTAREWPVLIVVDTLARCFIGDENKQESMGNFIAGIDRLKNEFCCSVLILHHTGRDESRERGSTVLGGACDTIYRLDAEAKDSTLTLTNEKMKDSAEPQPIHLSFQQVEVQRRPSDDTDEDLTSVVVLPGRASTKESLAQMVPFLKENGPLSWQAWFGQAQLPRTSFNRAISGLVKKGKIIKEKGVYRVL